MKPIPIPYCGAAPLPSDWLTQWNLDPGVLALLLAGAFVLKSAGSGIPAWIGLASLFLLFVSPLCALSSALFSIRVTHHIVLTALTAPLLAFALPHARGRLAAWTLAHAAIFWAWHMPQAYALALANDAIYWAMQASLLGSAICLWRAVRGASAPAAVAALLATMVQMGLLGALLTFSGTPLYSWHAATTQAWGLTPLADQQLAGLIMWVPGSGLYLAAALWLANGWLGERQRPAAA